MKRNNVEQRLDEIAEVWTGPKNVVGWLCKNEHTSGGIYSILIISKR